MRLIHGESNFWTAAHDGKRAKDVLLMLGLNETIDLLDMASIVCWYGDVWRREDGDVL